MPHQPASSTAVKRPAMMNAEAIATSQVGGPPAWPVTGFAAWALPYSSNPTSIAATASASTNSADRPGWRSVTPRTSAYSASITPRTAETGARSGNGSPLRDDVIVLVVTAAGGGKKVGSGGGPRPCGV